MKEYRNPPHVHQPIAAYTHQIEIRGPERLLVLSGQVGKREDGIVPDDPGEQLDIAMENLQRNLQAANMGVQDILKITFYLVGEMDAARRAVHTEPSCLGARLTHASVTRSLEMTLKDVGVER